VFVLRRQTVDRRSGVGQQIEDRLEQTVLLFVLEMLFEAFPEAVDLRGEPTQGLDVGGIGVQRMEGAQQLLQEEVDLLVLLDGST
jgi:hypothetical protein